MKKILSDDVLLLPNSYHTWTLNCLCRDAASNAVSDLATEIKKIEKHLFRLTLVHTVAASSMKYDILPNFHEISVTLSHFPGSYTYMTKLPLVTQSLNTSL